jgi:hypothetical protein
MALVFVIVMIIDYRSRACGGIKLSESCFWLCYFLWPVSSAIYENSRKTNIEWATYWGSVIGITPLLWLVFARLAE